MQDHFQAVVAAIASLLAMLGVPSLIAWLIRRASLRDETREQLIETLRKALDKGRVRESAYAGALDALVIGIDYLDHPPPALLAAKARALELMENAQRQIMGAD